jgi:hypothetical protein
MPRNPGPIVKINIGGRPRSVAFGFNEFAAIEDSLGPGWMAQLQKPTVKGLLAILSAGLSRYDDTATPHQVGLWLDELAPDELAATIKLMMQQVGRALGADAKKKTADRPENNGESEGGDNDDAAPLAPAEHKTLSMAAGTGMAS